MPALVLCQATRPCPRCGGEKLLWHSHVCGYCFEMAVLGSDARKALGDLTVTGELVAQQWADIQLGAGLAVGLGAVAFGAGASAAAGVLVATGWSLATLADAALAFLGVGGVTLGSLTTGLLLHLRAHRPYAVVGLTDALLDLPWRRARTVWREVFGLRACEKNPGQ